MYPDPTLTLAGQLFWIADVFYKTLAPEACKRRVGLFGLALWNRVKRFERRFCALHAMWKAGTLPAVRRRDGAPRRAGAGGGGAFDPMACDGASMERARARPASVLPRAFAWMPKMLPASSAVLGGGVDSLLRNYPEMREFAAACPQVGRVLRPICRMTGIKPPDYLQLPKRVRARRPALRLTGEDEEKLRRITARFPDTPAARSAKRALRRMFAGKPVNLERMSAVAVGYFLHPPRDAHCPPPEVGYGGRSFAPLPKDYVRPEWD